MSEDVVPVPEPDVEPVNPTPGEPAPPKPSDAEAKLLKELMDAKKKLKAKEDALAKFSGVDLDELTQLRTAKAEAEEKARREEEERARKAGEFDKLTKAMGDQHAKELKAERDRVAAESKRAADLQVQIEDMTVGRAFGDSAFMRDETLLTPAKARKLYGSYFDVEDGVIKPFSAERDDPAREPLVDGSGKPLNFDEAMKRIIESDPDKDALLRSRRRPGTGNMPSGATGAPSPQPRAREVTGQERIAAALKSAKRG